eukprot:scaffold8419_cov62-Attheya_sp.AAC.3
MDRRNNYLSDVHSASLEMQHVGEARRDRFGPKVRSQTWKIGSSKVFWFFLSAILIAFGSGLLLLRSVSLNDSNQASKNILLTPFSTHHRFDQISDAEAQKERTLFGLDALMDRVNDEEHKWVPHVAILVCASSRGYPHMKNPVKNSSLVTLLIPSLMNTMEPDSYQYSIYIGIDEGDTIWEDAKYQKVVTDLVRYPSVAVEFLAFPQDKVFQKIPFTQTAKAAYEDGVDYFVRINDDSGFETKSWTSYGIAALLGYPTANVGVVGPSCAMNLRILTHDMVHRSHMDIFHLNYYPSTFHNWYLDDWISCVYGLKHRTLALPKWTVEHATESHGTRYKVYDAGKNALFRELRAGKTLIDSHLNKLHRNYNETQIRSDPNMLKMAWLKKTLARYAYAPQDEGTMWWSMNLECPSEFHQIYDDPSERL